MKVSSNLHRLTQYSYQVNFGTMGLPKLPVIWFLHFSLSVK